MNQISRCDALRQKNSKVDKDDLIVVNERDKKFIKQLVRNDGVTHHSAVWQQLPCLIF